MQLVIIDHTQFNIRIFVYMENVLKGKYKTKKMRNEKNLCFLLIVTSSLSI